MKQLVNKARNLLILACLMTAALAVFAQDSTSAAPPGSGDLPPWVTPAAGIVLGIYELLIRYIPTVKNYSVLGFIIRLIQTVVPNRNASVPTQPHPIIILPLLLVGSMAHAQSMFKPLPKPTVTQSLAVRAQAATVDTGTTVPFNPPEYAYRPVLSIAAYSYPGNHAMTGAGCAWEHLTYDLTQQKYTVDWSVGAYLWYNTPIPSGTSTNSSPVSGGIAATLLHGLILIGVSYDGVLGTPAGGAHFGLVTGFNVNLN